MSGLGGDGLGVSAVGIWTKTLQKGVASVWGQEEADICCASRSSEACCDLKVRMWLQMAIKVDPESSLALGNYKNMANYA